MECSIFFFGIKFTLAFILQTCQVYFSGRFYLLSTRCLSGSLEILGPQIAIKMRSQGFYFAFFEVQTWIAQAIKCSSLPTSKMTLESHSCSLSCAIETQTSRQFFTNSKRYRWQKLQEKNNEELQKICTTVLSTVIHTYRIYSNTSTPLSENAPHE